MAFTYASLSVVAPMIEIRWKSSDRVTAAQTHAAATASSSSPAGISATTPEPAHSGGLSTGAKVAIGVVVPVVVIATLIAIFFFWRRKIRALRTDEWPQSAPSAAASSDRGVEMREYRNSPNQPKPEARPQELEAMLPVQEMEGSAVKNHPGGRDR